VRDRYRRDAAVPQVADGRLPQACRFGWTIAPTRLAYNARMPASPAIRLDFYQRARGLAETLAWLRLCAIAGQALTVAVVALGLALPIPVMPLALGIGALGLFALFAFWRLEQPWPIRLAEAFGHVAVDILVLAYLLYWSGGVGNPFVSLLVIPIALAAAALSLRYVAAVAALASACFLLLIGWHAPLPSLHEARIAGSDLHVVAVCVNFVVTAAVLAFFIARLARALRARGGDDRAADARPWPGPAVDRPGVQRSRRRDGGDRNPPVGNDRSGGRVGGTPVRTDRPGAGHRVAQARPDGHQRSGSGRAEPAQRQGN